MEDFGIKIAKEGTDVTTAEDKDLVYSTKYNGMKIKTHNTRASSGAMSHGLTYVPMFINYQKVGTFYRLQAQVGNYDLPTYATSSNIVFDSTDNYYFIFVDRG